MRKRSKPFIVGNWKTTPSTVKEASTFIKTLERKLSTSKQKISGTAYYIAAPDIFIPTLIPIATHGEIGAQNSGAITTGQQTGLTTSGMLQSAGATFTILGHSEARARGEDIHTISQKVDLSLRAKLLTILCVGEKMRDQNGQYLAELEEELRGILAHISRELFSNLIIAYEPVWAIGQAEPATITECFEVVIALRRALASLVGIEYAKKVAIIYGGSVTAETTRSFLTEAGVDGLLIGKASQNVTAFMAILRAAHTA
jgi:triosephosphate isomerase